MRLLKEDQPPGDLRDARIRHILGEMHILLVNHNMQWGTDEADCIRQDPAAWWVYNQSDLNLAQLRSAHQEVAAKLARCIIEHHQFVSQYSRIMDLTRRYIREPKKLPIGRGQTA